MTMGFEGIGIRFLVPLTSDIYYSRRCRRIHKRCCR